MCWTSLIVHPPEGMCDNSVSRYVYFDSTNHFVLVTRPVGTPLSKTVAKFGSLPLQTVCAIGKKLLEILKEVILEVINNFYSCLWPNN
jgi:hypothetical protein